MKADAEDSTLHKEVATAHIVAETTHKKDSTCTVDVRAYSEDATAHTEDAKLTKRY